MEDMLQYADMNPDSRIARSMKAAVTQNEAVLNAWVDAVSVGVENFRMQDGQKKERPGGREVFVEAIYRAAEKELGIQQEN